MTTKTQAEQDIEDLFGPDPKKAKEVAMVQQNTPIYPEAPVSFNIKFFLSGFEAQLTLRGASVVEAARLIEQSTVILKGLKAEPRLVATGGNGKVKVNAEAQGPVLCPGCKRPAQPISGVSQKNGKAYSSQKCPQCNEFVPGTFRWA